MEQVLLLNKSFEPITIISWKRALCMFMLGKVEIIEEYKHEVRSQRLIMRMPAVVRLLHNFKRIKRNVSFTKNNIFARDKWICQYCLEKFSSEELTLDHVLPKSKGGRTCWENIVTCCIPCNSKKGNKLPGEAYMQLQRQPIRPEWISLFGILLSRRSVPEEWKQFCYF